MAQQTQQEELAGALSEDVFGAGIAKPEEEKALEVMEAQPAIAGSAMQDNGEIGPAAIIPEKTGGAWLVPATDEQGRMLTREETERRFAESTRSGRGQAYGLFEDIEQARTYRQAHMSHEGRVQMRAALAVAKGIPQERVARDKALAERLGVDPLTVHYARDEAEERGLEKELEDYEGLQEYASRSQFHAAYVRGDLAQLKAVEMWDKQYERQRAEEGRQEQARIEAGGWGGEVLAPNVSSKKTWNEALTKSELQAKQSDLVGQWIERFEAGDDAGAEEIRKQIEAANFTIARNAAALGPDESWLRTTKVVPAMLEQAYTSMPIQLKSLGAGAAAAGTVLAAGAMTGPGVAGAVPLAGTAFKGAALATSTIGTFYLERNLALASMLSQTDAQGNRLPPDIALEAATLYGAVSAGLETVSEAAFLSAFKKIEKTAGGSGLGRALAGNAWVRDVAQSLQKDPAIRESVRGALSKAGLIAGRALPYVQRAGKVGSAESFTEATQEAANVIAEVSAGALANQRDGTSFSTDVNTPENRARIADSAAQGFWAGLGFGAGPIVVSSVYHGVRARSAANYAQREQERHQVVEQTWTHANDPAALREVLETVAPETQQQVEIPLDRAVQLQQSGVDILAPLGITPEQAQDWAAKGLTVRASVAELHAFMNQEQFNAASQIFERYGESATEIQTADEELARTLRQMAENGERVEAARAAELWLSPEERTEFGAEVDRLRAEMRSAAQASPNLSAQAEAVGGIESVLDKVLAVSRRQASIEARRTGQKPADVLRRKVVRTLEQAAEQANRSTEEAVEADIEAELSEPAAEAVAEQQTAEAQAEPVEQPMQTAQDGIEGAEAVQPQPAEHAQAETAPAGEAEQVEAVAVQEPAEQKTAAPAGRRARGKSDSLAVSSGDEPFTYEVWELGDLIPSHDPTAGFVKREDYPAGVQERPYHSDKGEQEKVRRNAGALDPRYLINTNPDAMSGPPVITSTGIVLGGNSRTMSIQVAYANQTERAAAYRQAVIDQAQTFGVNPAAVSGMAQPVLVRVVDKDMSQTEMAQASRRYNEVTTQALQSEAEGVSKSKLVSDKTLAAFTADIEDFDTIRDFLSSPKSRDFVAGLMGDGVIEPTQASRLTDAETGLLNPEGKNLVVNTLRGLVVQDYDIIRKAAGPVLDKIDRAIPDLVSLRNRGGQWAKAVSSVQEAVNQINKWQASGTDTFPHTLANVHLHFDQGGLIADPQKSKKAVQALAVTLATATPKEFQARVATMEAEAKNSTGKANAMSAMLGAADKPVSPAGAFVRAFLKPVAVVDGKAVRGFDPENNPAHKAIQWASENSGASHSIETAQNKLTAILADKKASKEEKAAAKERMQILSSKSGKAYTYGKPSLGAFSYRKSAGDVLWQSEPISENPLAVLFQRAWHGSKFKFDRFTLEHIGEGEGAQIHGWGLYFAQSKEISDKRYRERLIDNLGPKLVELTVNGKKYQGREVEGGIHWYEYGTFADVPSYEHGHLDRLFAKGKTGETNEEYLSALEEWSKKEEYTAEQKEILKRFIDEYKNASIEVDANEGQLYEVEIPDNDVLLDEQKIIFEQPEKVIEAYINLCLEKDLEKNLFDNIRSIGGERAVTLAKDVLKTGDASKLSEEENDKLAEKWNEFEKLCGERLADDLNAVSNDMLKVSGGAMYDRLASMYGSAKAASLALKEQGVLGITYEGNIDGRCFVVWDEDAIQIYNTLYQAKLDAHQQELEQTPDAFARGAVTDADGNYFIDLFKRADLSTLFHELGHTYFLSLEKYVRDGTADAEMQADYEKLCKWLGAAPGEALTVEQHEQLARGWEAYLMEGKAPSEELRGVFQRICEWLLAIYRSVKALGVELNDEVRGVFDRMLATREEIEDAAARYELVDRTTGELQAMGMDPAQMAYTRRVLDAARQAAFVRLREKRDSDRKARLADYRRLAMNELRGEQVHQAHSDMRKTPLDLEAVKALMGDEMTARLQKKQPGTFKKEGGIDPGQFAMEHGYESAEAMLADMDSQPTLGKAVAERVDQMSKDYDQQYSAEEALFDSQELTEHASLIARQLAQITGRPYIQQQAVRQVAEQEMSGRPMREAMRVGDFRLNVRRALRDERRAVAQGKFAEALEANTKARINLELARMSQELRDGVDKSAKAVRRFVGSKSVAEVAKAFLAQLVRQHSFLGPDYAGGIVSKYSIEDLTAWQKKLEEDGYTMLIAPDVLATATVWRDMTVEQWQDFADAVRQVVTIERNQRKLLTAQGKKDLDEAVSELADSLKQHNKAKVNGRAVPDAVRALRRYHTAHMKVEQACIMLDGGKRGPLWHLLYEPINKAADEQAVELRKARDYLRDKLFGMYTKKEFRNLGKKIWVEAVGMSLTGEQILCIALNMGNKVNEERVKTGYGWDDAKLSSVLSRLTAKDWQFVQAVWDYLETFREPAFKVHEAVTGSRPRAVEAEARNVQTADGLAIRLRGGYYPIRYDPVENSTQFERDQKAMDQQLFGGRNYGAAQTKQGHLKERAEGGLGTPLLFDFTVLADHVFNVIHDITHRKAVLDVAKIIRNGKAKDAIETYAGREMYQELMPWLQDVANERQAPMSQIQRMAAWARSAGTIMQMGYKATTIAMVPFGYTQTIAEIGYGYGMLGYWHALKGLFYASTGQWKKHVAMREFVYSKSPFMRHRLENFDRDIRDFSKQINAGPISGWVDKARANAFLPMGYLQLWAVDMPSWWASYEKGLKENGGNEDDAAAYADSVVRRTQASGATKDLARVQRGSDLHKLLTMFYSYFNTLYNLGAQHIRALKEDHTPAGIWKAANAAILLWFLPSVLSEFAAGRTPEGDDDDEWLKWAAKIWIQVPFQACVFVRDIAGAVFSGFDYQLSPAQSAPASVAKFFTSMYKAIEKQDPSLAVKPTAEAVGYALRLPAKQPIITAQNMWEYCTDPRSEMYLRDIFFVKPKKRQKKQ